MYTKWLPEINLRKQKGILPVQTPVFVMGHKIDLAMNEENANAVKNSSEFFLRHPFPISDEAYAKTWSSLPSTDPLRSRIVKFVSVISREIKKRGGGVLETFFFSFLFVASILSC